MSSTCPRRHLRQQLPFTAQFTLTYDQIGSNKLKMKLRISLFSCLSLGCIGRNSCKLEVLCTADGQTQSQITSFQSIAPLSGRSSGFVRQYDNLRCACPAPSDYSNNAHLIMMTGSALCRMSGSFQGTSHSGTTSGTPCRVYLTLWPWVHTPPMAKVCKFV